MIHTMCIICQLSLGSDNIFANASFVDGRSLPDFHFAAEGDWGCSSITKSTARNIIDKDPE